MPKIPGVSHKLAIKALGKAGFKVIREGNTRFLEMVPDF
jgi:predicted RNA binding protein YcfA (HicA-like mRNA interferase family)